MMSDDTRLCPVPGLLWSGLLLLWLLLPACITSPRSLPTSHPGAHSKTDNYHFELGVGMQMMFQAKLVSTEGVTSPGGLIDLPDRIAVLQMPHVAFRKGIGQTCDWGLEGGLGQTGASLRCGLRRDDWSASFQAGAHWLPLENFQSHGELQAGYKGDNFMFFVTAGLLYSILKHAHREDNSKALSGMDLLYYGPDGPWLEIYQHDLAAQLGLVWGVRYERRSPFLYMGVSCDLPFWYSKAKFTCHGCRSADDYLSFDPGLRLGVLLGMSF